MNIHVTSRPTQAISRFHQCVVCGTPFPSKRSTKRYCSDRCRKAADRAPPKDQADADRMVIEELRSRGMIGQIWPVYRWDTSRRIDGLLVARDTAARELGMDEAKLGEVLRRSKVAVDRVEERLVRQFYAERKDRRVLRDEALSRTETELG